MNHCIWFWPYVSDFSTCPPETSIFAILIQISGWSSLLTAYIRHRLVIQCYGVTNFGARFLLTNLNRLSLCAGSMICLGMCLDASFPETSGDRVHGVAGTIAFTAAIFFWILQIFIGRCLHGNRWLQTKAAQLRLYLCVIAVVISQIGAYARRRVSHRLWNQLWSTAHHCNNSYIPEDSWSEQDRSRYWYSVTTLVEFALGMLISIHHLLISAEFYRVYSGLRPVLECNFGWVYRINPNLFPTLSITLPGEKPPDLFVAQLLLD